MRPVDTPAVLNYRVISHLSYIKRLGSAYIWRSLDDNRITEKLVTSRIVFTSRILGGAFHAER
jgi:hypothetical protein